LKELENMAQQLADYRHKKGSMTEASSAYKQMMRGRYEYLNEFMEDMQQEPEEMKKMTKRQELRLVHKMRMQADSTKYIVGSFFGGTALCAGVFYATWVYTKYSLDVKDGTEYAEKMRALTPNTKNDLAQGFVGRSVTSFKAFTMEWLESKDSFRRFKRTMKAGFGDLQQDIQRRPSGGHDARFLNKAVSGMQRRISGRISGGRPLGIDAIIAKVDGETAAKDVTSEQKGWGWGYLSPFSLKAPPLSEEQPLDTVSLGKSDHSSKGSTEDSGTEDKS